MARSSTKAEFKAMPHGICEKLWLKHVLEELRQPSEEAMKLYCDNKAEFSIAHNLIQHDRAKHMEIDRHFIKEKLEGGLICMPYVGSGSQLADVLTKGLNGATCHGIISKLGMEDIYSLV